MGGDAKEGFANDNKCGNMEDGLRSQIVEIQAVIEHEPPDEWMERKAQSAEEVGKEYDPLMGPGVGMSCPLLGSRCAMSLDRYPALRSLLMCPSITEEVIHLPPAPDMTGEG